MGPIASIGSARTQWGEQKVKAIKVYLQKMTPTKKNIMQITFIPESGGKINWIAFIDAEFTTINKCAAPPQSEKRGAEKQLSDSTSILTDLVTLRRRFNTSATQLDKETALQGGSSQGHQSYFSAK